MSKLIVEMEMPICCVECACCDTEYQYCAASRKQLDDLNERPNWCPIVGVLPEEHGDLIDRDAMKQDAKFYCGMDCTTNVCYECEFKYIDEFIDRQPKIVAAERKDDEQIH